MGSWSITLADPTTNLVANPSFETNITGWTVGGINTLVQSTAQSFLGSHAALCTFQNHNSIALYAITLTAAAHSVSARIYIPTTWDGSDLALQLYGFVGATGTTEIDADMTIRDQWQTVEVPNVVIAPGDLVGFVRVRHAAVDATAGRFIYLDAVQCEAKAYCTTYTDGTQLGSEWTGAPHASTSTRSALETRGGLLVDLEDYNLIVEDSLGAGMPPVQNLLARHGQQPGGVFQRQNILPRTLTLVGSVSGTGRTNLHSLRESIIDALKIDRSPGGLPVRLWYDNGTTVVYIDAQYDSGMDLGRTTGPGAEKVAIRLLADDPFFYHEGDISEPLDVEDAPTLRYVAGRLRSTGQWDDLGLVADPGANGTIYAIKYNPHDGLVYFGGRFSDMNGVVGRDYAAAYDPATDTWATLGAGAAVNSTVRAITIAPNGDVYFGGDFTDLGGAAGDYVAYWDISGAAWVPVAAGGTVGVNALAFGHDGMLYIGGYFVNWNALGANYCVKWDGAAYAVMDAGNELIALVNDIAVHPNGDIYIGGSFTQFGANV